MKTSSIRPAVESVIAKPVQVIANNSYMKKFCDKFEMSPDKWLGITTIASIVGKDSVGCYMYVKQSLNNEKIPEEKRSFVASLDLTNGLLMIVSQLIAFFTLNKPSVQNKLFGKFFDKIFEAQAVRRLITRIRNATAIKGETSLSSNKLEKVAVKAEIDKIKKGAKDMFGFITSLIASTTIAKRIVVPFIATPLAGWAQEKFIDKKIKGSSDDDTEVIISEGEVFVPISAMRKIVQKLEVQHGS